MAAIPHKSLVVIAADLPMADHEMIKQRLADAAGHDDFKLILLPAGATLGVWTDDEEEPDSPIGFGRDSEV